MAYKSSYTGPQIDQAVSHAVNMDVNPTAGHTDRVVSSGGVKSALNTVDESIAIRVSGNKTTYASGAAIGQYVIVDGSTIPGITDGLYKSAKAIPYNTGIDSTYLTAVSGGGMNDLKAAIGSIMGLRIFNWYQMNFAHTITFSGTAKTRIVYGVLFVLGQGGTATPIWIVLSGAESGGQTSSVTYVVVSENNLGVTSSDTTITIPAGIGGNWGTVSLILFYDEPTLTVTHTAS